MTGIMIGLPELVAGVMVVALVFYAVFAGADFGGGIWDLLATGSRAKRQRELIEKAIAPVWEANHVWLILIVVLLFTGFPRAFSAASIWLHVPLTIMLVGIVFRGAAFVFRRYDMGDASSAHRWGRIFAVSSIVSPFFLGISLGAITVGRIDVDAPPRDFVSAFVSPWLHPFPILVGLFALGLFAFLAAVYLTVEARTAGDHDLEEDFRKRALVSGTVAILVGAVTALGPFFSEMTHVRAQLVSSVWIWLFSGLGAASWLASLYALQARRYPLARILTVAVVTFVLIGWSLGQYPYLIHPRLTIRNTAAPAATLRLLLVALGAGAAVLLPSMYWLLRIFKMDRG